MAGVVNGYCTTAQLRTQLGDDAVTQSVELLDRAVNASSRAIDRYCRRRFWLDATVTTRLHRVSSSTRASVDDIGSTAGLVIKTDPGLDGSWSTTWAAADYQLGPLNQDVVASGDTGAPFAFWFIEAIGDLELTTAARRTTLQVTAKHGWSAVPDEVAQACVLKAASLFKRKDAPFGVAGFADFGAVRISKEDPQVVELLRDYRRFQALVA